MKVLAIVFTVRREGRSLTLQTTEEICRTIASDWGGGTETEIVTMSEMPVQPCAGCKTCFCEGMCPQDSGDSMAELRKKLKECDVLIAATPVYMTMVSGWCKNFLDRCASYCHVFELAGKPCLVISVTGMTGAETTAGYLSDMLEVMGCAVAGRLPLVKQGEEGLVYGSEAAKNAVRDAVAALRDAAANPEKYISEKTEQQFEYIREVNRRMEVVRLLSGKTCSWETNTFRERGYMNGAPLREFLRKGDKCRE